MPEAGGPATYVPRLARELVKLKYQVLVITYSDYDQCDFDESFPFEVLRIKRRSKLMNYLKYFWVVFRYLKNFDCIYSFDYYSAGIPSVLASKLRNKKVFLRNGGDLIWEKHLRLSGEGITLKDFYQKNIYKRYLVQYFVAKTMFKFFDLVIFSTQFQGKIFINNYDIASQKVKYIYNPLPVVKTFRSENINNEVIWAGRIIKKNNIERLIRVWCDLKIDNFKLIIIGEGENKETLKDYVKNKKNNTIFFREKVLSEELMEIMTKSYAMVLPSYTDISPNQALECLATHSPFIITKEHGFDWLRGKVIEFDPCSDEDLKKAIQTMLDKNFLNQFNQQLGSIKYNYTFFSAAQDTVNLFHDFLK